MKNQSGEQRATMPAPRPKLSHEDISKAFLGKAGEEYPVILSPVRFAELLGQSPKTIYDWIARGRLDGAFRKRGKHILIWRNRALDIIFNGRTWSKQDGQG